MFDTICAISTAQGIGGIAVIRVSGSNAISIVDQLFVGKSKLCQAKGYTAHYGSLADIDDVVATVFRAPLSFTGEDVVEISCHGSVYIQQQLLTRLLAAGCRLARAGEFTERAFLNGRIDLSQAEAVADLIAAQTRAAHDLALNHLRGGVSNELTTLREKLLEFTSLIELELDFADHEDLEFVDRSELMSLAAHIENRLTTLLQSFRLGNAMKNGVQVAIVGATNAGKSTLLNALVGEERAIVSDIAGTTRDTIEDTIVIDDILFRFIDTAGIRQTQNTIEALGIERSRRAVEKADIVLLVKDVTQTPEHTLELPLEGKELITIYNKIDKLNANAISQLLQTDSKALCISAKNGDMTELKTALLNRVRTASSEQDAVMISNVRHRDAIEKALIAIKNVVQGLKDDLSGELLSIDLRDCLNALGEITGQITSQEVLNNIFSKFCIGK